MNTLALTFLCAIASLIAVFDSALAQGAATDVAEIRHGEYIATASDCEACHTAPGGKRLAGGLPIESPLGTIYSTNITPSKQHGLGNYSLQQFSDALRRGIRGDGAHLYPAMPYVSYALLTDEDVKALYAYFTKAVPAVDEAPAKTTSLPFPSSLFDDVLEPAVPQREALYPRSIEVVRVEPGRISCQRPDALRRVPYAARLLYAAGPQPRIRGRGDRLLVCAQY